MAKRQELSDEGAVTSKQSVVDVAAQIEALKARIEEAKRTTAASGRETGPQSPQRLPESAPPARIGARRFRRNVILAVVLVLLAGGAALIFTGADGPSDRTRDPRASTNTTMAIDRASPGVSDPAPASPGPPASAPAIQDIRPPPAPEALSLPAGLSASGPGATVVVAAGESFWSIAARVVEERGGGTTAEVASYWLELIEVNRDRLVQAGNPDLIYVGQEFSLP